MLDMAFQNNKKRNSLVFQSFLTSQTVSLRQDAKVLVRFPIALRGVLALECCNRDLYHVPAQRTKTHDDS